MLSKIVLVSVIALAACRETPLTLRTSQRPEGAYVLIAVNGLQPPALAWADVVDSIWVLDGELTLTSRVAELRFRERYRTTWGVDSIIDARVDYTATVKDDSVWLTPPCGAGATCAPGWVGYGGDDTLDLTMNVIPRQRPVFTFEYTGASAVSR